MEPKMWISDKVIKELLSLGEISWNQLKESSIIILKVYKTSITMGELRTLLTKIESEVKSFVIEFSSCDDGHLFLFIDKIDVKLKKHSQLLLKDCVDIPETYLKEKEYYPKQMQHVHTLMEFFVQYIPEKLNFIIQTCKNPSEYVLLIYGVRSISYKLLATIMEQFSFIEGFTLSNYSSLPKIGQIELQLFFNIETGNKKRQRIN